MRQVEVCGSGHYGPSFSCVEILVALYYGFLRIDPARPQWPARDRFILSKGHACSSLYAILADLGFFPVAELSTFTQLGSNLGDHPDMRKVPGIDFSSGALGHGLSIGIGMAVTQPADDPEARTVVLLGDGELNEGQIWEAAAYAGANAVSNLLAIVDINKVCVDGRTDEVLSFEPLQDKWSAFGWHVERLDGHDLTALHAAFERFAARHRDGGPPTVILADTISGRGIDFIEGMAEWHLGFLGGTDVDRAIASIDSMYPAGSGR
jgi:transketolase